MRAETLSMIEREAEDRAAAHRNEVARWKAENERLRAALISVHEEIDLRKSPRLLAKIEAALGIVDEQLVDGEKP